ncbi:hemicentin-2-like [Gracilinanus agilis]|uniref:hemicentin-2-like n=1 Tax=Gracilinanus agilis TaxID=191870 RepID=UPI001CFE2B21|nr:hemicentin-2-like [Gracilinanus agilis]
MDDTGEYECVAHNLLGAATAHAFVAVKGDPRGSRGSMVGEINGQEFGVAYLNTSVLQEDDNGATTIQSSINNIPPEVGPLMRILVVAIAPIYWVLAGQSGEVLNGYSLTRGNFRQESQVEFATGELLHLTQVARGLDRDGLLLLDVVVNGFIPEVLAVAQLQVQKYL